MRFTMSALAHALADYLAPALPGVRFYKDPVQQGMKPPALFLRQTNARMAKQTGDRFLRHLGLDLVYEEQFHTVDGDSRLQAAAEVLDEQLELIPYQNTFLRTSRRRWEITGSALHYKFELKLWLTRQEDAALMQSIQALNMEENT